MAQDNLQVQLLGPVSAQLRGTEVELGGPLQRAVFVLLATQANRVVGRSELIDAIWGERAPASAEGNVHTYVSSLRGRLGDERGDVARIRRRHGGYELRLDHGELDVDDLMATSERALHLRLEGNDPAALTALDHALSLWRGQALLGVPGPFAEAERTRLAALRLELSEARAKLLLRSGQTAEAVVSLAQLVRSAPQHEMLATLNVLALYRAGRQADAVQEFHRIRGVLIKELNLPASSTLLELYERILHSDPVLLDPQLALLADGDRWREGRQHRDVPAQRPGGNGRFDGRADELDQLLQWVAPAAGAATVIVIDGNAGVGKTMLAQGFLDRIASRYPDGQLYLDLHGDDRSAAMSTQQALSRLLRSLGGDRPAVPAELPELCARYRTMMSGQRMLLLLDNAANSEQVRDLLPGASKSLVVITSRSRLAGLITRTGARRLTLQTAIAARGSGEG
ncbi:MAG: hypothetical protein JWN95_4115 [Frankiales bacterium]|nr:hypothetical protein [Frankiales bacterium]